MLIILVLLLLGFTNATKIAPLTEKFDQKDLALLLDDSTKPLRDRPVLEAEVVTASMEKDIKSVEESPCQYPMNRAIILAYKHGYNYGIEETVNGGGKQSLQRLSLITRMALQCARRTVEESTAFATSRSTELLKAVESHYEQYPEQQERMSQTGFIRKALETFVPPPPPLPQTPQPPPQRSYSDSQVIRSSTSRRYGSSDYRPDEKNDEEIEKLLDGQAFDNLHKSPYVNSSNVPSRRSATEPRQPHRDEETSPITEKPEQQDTKTDEAEEFLPDNEENFASFGKGKEVSKKGISGNTSKWTFFGFIKSLWTGFVGLFSSNKRKK